MNKTKYEKFFADINRLFFSDLEENDMSIETKARTKKRRKKGEEKFIHKSQEQEKKRKLKSEIKKIEGAGRFEDLIKTSYDTFDLIMKVYKKK